ncbi:SDR family NAD(P)-dependent oxidoreductase [Devosia algicola]|uniref:SDR family NAD(P)-dependent oxidoreductase n=1 Tax=Devosia algicola TaxID=3026418 RepID=A0ABY7YTY2_9HYPH|nr:SDR family NAD(P)-dependent oxidoreductase [Devosia algicola]WDR04305.1 SDR family NAD(P)-dependent oxidoreductase [Devosia algicola]
MAATGSAGMPAYSASKGALAGLARSLASEWRHRIALRHFRLWPTRTPMHAKAGFDPHKFDWLLMNPDAVASFVVDRLESARRVNQTISPASLFTHRLVGARP